MLTTPPKFVPTLTDMVPPSPKLGTSAEPVLPAAVEGSAGHISLDDAAMLRIERRVLQNVTDKVMHLLEATLEKQVREAVASIALTHAHAIAQDIMPAVEIVVTQTLETALRQALAKELGDESGYR
jgi:hypothetical protein